MTNKWRGLKKIVMIGLMFKSLRNIIIQALLEIDLEKIKPDEADFYYVCDRVDYMYGGLTHEQRMLMSLGLDKKVNNNRPTIKKKSYR
jgi:hypothetical protein